MAVDHDRARMYHEEEQRRNEILALLKRFPGSAVEVKVPLGTWSFDRTGASAGVVDESLKILLENPPDPNELWEIPYYDSALQGKHAAMIVKAADWIQEDSKVR